MFISVEILLIHDVKLIKSFSHFVYSNANVLKKARQVTEPFLNNYIILTQARCKATQPFLKRISFISKSQVFVEFRCYHLKG